MSAASGGRLRISSRGGGRVVADGADMLMLGSNDYLGLSTDPRVLAATCKALDIYGAGACLYPVFATTPLHEDLQRALADFLGVESAMIYSSGGAANAGVLTTLVGAGDLIFSDRLNHASIIDGCRLSRADVVSYENRDVERLREALERADPTRRKLIITDGVFSMEGGAAPLREIYALAREHDALLVVDEAHATGVVGPGGAGTAPFSGLPNNAPGLALTGSLSKALGGASGGFVAGARATIERLQAHSRGWIFSMGMTTANAATALAAIDVATSEPMLRQRLWDNVARLRNGLIARDLPIYDSDSAIIGVMIGDGDKARQVAAALRGKGIYAPAVAYPIVGRGEARLRLQVSAAHAPEDLDAAAAVLADVMESDA